MKHSLLILFFSLLLHYAQSQKAEKIYGRAREQRPLSYYKEQAIAWKKEVEKTPKNPEAWYNYYYVNRNLYYSDSTDTRTDDEKQAFITKLIDDMGKNVPESYEYNICKWMAGGFNLKLLPYLKKAAELGPNRTEHIDNMINISEINRDLKDRDVYSIKKFEAGQFSTGIIYYNYNVLAGLEKNAIIITGGDNDTYPIWYLQSLGIRKDVKLVHLSLIYGLDEYRDKIFDELGVEKWKRTESNGAQTTHADMESFRKNIIEHIAANKKNSPVYVTLTAACNQDYINGIMDKLYLTGLAYVFSKNTIDNLAILKRNVEQEFALDYLDKSFYKELSPDLVKMINGNYIIPFLKLYEHYKLCGDTQKAQDIKNKLLGLSKETEYEQEISKYFSSGN